MKKLLSISAVLLTAALIFTGCAQPTNSDGGNTNPGPGNWRDMTTADHYTSYTARNGRVITVSGNTVTFTGDKNNLDDADKPTDGFSYWTNQFTLDGNSFTGFTASAKGTSSNSGCGLVFCGTDTATSYNAYTLLLANGGYKVKKVTNGTSTEISGGWINNTNYVKAEPQDNEVTVYKDGTKLVIKINGNLAFEIREAEYTSGWIGFTTNIGADDTTVSQTYTFKKVQY